MNVVRDVLEIYQKYFRDCLVAFDNVLRIFQSCFRNALVMFSDVLVMVEGCFKDLFTMCQGCFGNILALLGKYVHHTSIFHIFIFHII